MTIYIDRFIVCIYIHRQVCIYISLRRYTYAHQVYISIKTGVRCSASASWRQPERHCGFTVTLEKPRFCPRSIPSSVRKQLLLVHFGSTAFSNYYVGNYRTFDRFLFAEIVTADIQPRDGQDPG